MVCFPPDSYLLSRLLYMKNIMGHCLKTTLLLTTTKAVLNIRKLLIEVSITIAVLVTMQTGRTHPVKNAFFWFQPEFDFTSKDLYTIVEFCLQKCGDDLSQIDIFEHFIESLLLLKYLKKKDDFEMEKASYDFSFLTTLLFHMYTHIRLKTIMILLQQLCAVMTM